MLNRRAKIATGNNKKKMKSDLCVVAPGSQPGCPTFGRAPSALRRSEENILDFGFIFLNFGFLFYILDFGFLFSIFYFIFYILYFIFYILDFIFSF